MPKQAKRLQQIDEKVQKGFVYKALDAFELLKTCSTVKFTESVDVSINLGVDPRKSDQMIRGATVLPNGTGRDVRVAVFAERAEMIEEAKAAGADKIGFEDLAEEIKKGVMDFDVIIASPDTMRLVGQLGQILGPRGLMPNPKVGTVSNEIGNAVKNAKAGQVRYRTDKTGIVHCTIGKVDFEAKALQENLGALIADIKKAKPTNSKGTYLKKITISTTMGPGLLIDQSTLEG